MLFSTVPLDKGICKENLLSSYITIRINIFAPNQMVDEVRQTKLNVQLWFFNSIQLHDLKKKKNTRNDFSRNCLLLSEDLNALRVPLCWLPPIPCCRPMIPHLQTPSGQWAACQESTGLHVNHSTSAATESSLCSKWSSSSPTAFLSS